MKRTKLIFVVGTAAALVAACSSSKTTASTSAPVSASHAATTPPARQSRSATPARRTTSSRPVSGPVLSGSWKGTYSGAYSGTFVLRWTQSTSKLTGTIDLSTAPGAVTINGTVTGGRIHFGTVGSQAITYAGTVSGNSMSGQYTIAGGAGGAGTWSATRG